MSSINVAPCSYCGVIHTYSPGMCRDMFLRAAPSDVLRQRVAKMLFEINDVDGFPWSGESAEEQDNWMRAADRILALIGGPPSDALRERIFTAYLDESSDLCQALAGGAAQEVTDAIITLTAPHGESAGEGTPDA